MIKHSRIVGFFLTLTLLMTISGCSGYRQVSDAPIVLNESERKLAIGEITNPTLETWLIPELRSTLRTEINNRGWIQWSSRRSADSILNIDVKKYTNNASLTGTDETTLRHSSSITLEATIISRVNKNVIWRSGKISVSESWYHGEEEQANTQMVEQAVRRIMERMEQNY